MKEKNKGCLKELKRLKRHYLEERKEVKYHEVEKSYTTGIVDGLDMAIEIIKNKDKYGD